MFYDTSEHQKRLFSPNSDLPDGWWSVWLFDLIELSWRLMFYSLEPLCVLFAFLLQLGSSFVLTQTLGCFDPNEVVTSLRKQFTFLLVLFL